MALLLVGSNTTKDNIYCETNHVSLFGGLMLTLPNIAESVEEIFYYEAIVNNMVCLISVAVAFIIYLILLVWCIDQYKKDVLRGEIIILHDSYVGVKHSYQRHKVVTLNISSYQVKVKIIKHILNIKEEKKIMMMRQKKT
ncbi:Hypothetical protein CINCED_3A025070 [Cinara cedri]|uniref:Uncharacterized protein n=1 Tax=Cinara cedri TaxID=506608 RepID=A0A5E4M5I5_9HEMI|nr:Hypothetical protein CINCED_3A025070 [Cinara cedri]